MQNSTFSISFLFVFNTIFAVLILPSLVFAQGSDLLSPAAKASFKKENYEPCVAELSVIIGREPANIPALKGRVECQLLKTKGAANRPATADLLKLIELEPNNEANYKTLGEQCFKFALPYTCSDFFKKYAAVKPNSVNAYLGLARSNASVEIYYSLDNREGYWKAAADAYLKAIELEPASIEPCIELFDLYHTKIRSKMDAQVMAVRILRKFPNSPQSYVLSGRVAESNRDWTTAVAEFTRAIELNPKFSLAYERRSNAYEGLKEFDKAFADINKAIELDPRNGNAYLTRGNFLSFQKKYQEAISDFNEADKLNVTCAKTYRGINYGAIAMEKKEARDTGNFTNAARDFLTDDSQKCYLTHYMYGVSLYAQKFYEQAAQQFNFALSVYKKYGYDTAGIIKFQNEIKAKSVSATTANVATAANVTTATTITTAEQIISQFKQTAPGKGFRVISSGVITAKIINDPALRFDVKNGEIVLLVAVKDYDPTFGFNIYTGSLFIRPTHNWNDNNFILDSSKDYGMKYANDRKENFSIFQMSLGLTKKSTIRTIQIMPEGKAGKIHWVLLKSN